MKCLLINQNKEKPLTQKLCPNICLILCVILESCVGQCSSPTINRTPVEGVFLGGTVFFAPVRFQTLLEQGTLKLFWQLVVFQHLPNTPNVFFSSLHVSAFCISGVVGVSHTFISQFFVKCLKRWVSICV